MIGEERGPGANPTPDNADQDVERTVHGAADRIARIGQLGAALGYAARGWAVFPAHTGPGCSCARLTCASPAKHPRLRHGLTEATTDSERIRAWWTRWPDANVAIATGIASGIFVLDVDPDHGGSESLARLEREHGELPATVESVTGGGGRHLLFRHPGVAVKTKAGIADGLDVRGDGGYIIGPPSVHASGQVYAWDLARLPEDRPIADAPPWLLNGSAAEAARRSAAARLPKRIPSGQRNADLTSLAGTMQRRGVSVGAIAAALRAENAGRCDPPLPDAEVDAIAASIARYERVKPAERLSLTDLGNARRLVASHGADVRFCYESGDWLVWEGRRFRRDRTGAVDRLAKATVRAIYADAATAATEDERKAIAKHAAASESAPAIRRMLDLGRSEPGIPVLLADLDADPWTLNAPNGMVDLRTGDLMAHRREALATRLTGAPFDRAAASEIWSAHLTRILPDPNVREYLQAALGVSLIGRNVEEAVFMGVGPGGSGKSTTVAAIEAALGDYAATADFASFTANRNQAAGGPRSDLVRLAGSRIVFSIETREGPRFAEGLVKNLTGGDRVTFRGLYAREVEFVPTFSLWLFANDYPRVRDDDAAIWRRVRLVPFGQQVPPSEVDPMLKARLRDDPEVRAAVLAWLVEGCLVWRARTDGGARPLEPPAAVRDATSGYREAMDPLRDWLEGRCVVAPHAKGTAAALFADYRRWAQEASSERPLSQRAFGLRLAERFGAAQPISGARTYHGVGLAAEPQILGAET